MPDWIFGRRPVLEALNQGLNVHRVLLAEGHKPGGVIAEIIAAAKTANVPIAIAPRAELDRRAQGAVHQGVVAAIASFSYADLDDIFARAQERGEPPFVLLLDSLQDVHNFGALARTAEAAGMHGIIITKDRAVAVTPTVYKTSAGAIAHLPVVQVTNLVRTMKEFKERGVWLAGLAPSQGQAYDEVNLTGPLGLVVGAEGSGLSRLTAETCDFLLTLPMHGQVSSLNASVAGAIVIYEALRQRQRQKSAAI
jgi:23S rRNA (guanosine2251-2'-O)-methyltransferase